MDGHTLEGAVDRELKAERGRNVLRMQVIRVVGISSAFAVALSFGLVKHQADWAVNLPDFGAYWVASTLLLFGAWRKPQHARGIGWLAALVDFPVVYVLQSQSLALSPSPGGVAGFSAAIFAALIAASSLV